MEQQIKLDDCFDKNNDTTKKENNSNVETVNSRTDTDWKVSASTDKSCVNKLVHKTDEQISHQEKNNSAKCDTEEPVIENENISANFSSELVNENVSDIEPHTETDSNTGISASQVDIVTHTGQDNSKASKTEDMYGDTNNSTTTDLRTDCDKSETKDGDEIPESSSESEDEYESAEEGEEIQVDAQNLKEMEENLTDEQKEARHQEAQEIKNTGNEMFRSGSYKSAIKAYSRALRICPLKFAKDRAIMYSNRAACKMRLDMDEQSIQDCTKAIDLHPHYLKALMRRAELYEKTEKLDEALADYQKILELDPSQYSARAACLRLPDQIKERNEKLKEEMMGKLKDLGNLVLRPFGLSTNNFKLNQDPNTGGYSVNFVQNPEQNQ